MDYYGNNDWRDYHLSHYGVKGMKKGKHLPGTDWWKDNDAKQLRQRNLSDMDAARQRANAANDANMELARRRANADKARSKRKGGGGRIFANAGGPGRGEIGGGKNRATAAAAASQTVQKETVKLDPSAFRNSGKATGKLKSLKQSKAVNNLFTKMGANTGSLLRDVASGKTKGTSMKKSKKSKSKKTGSRRKR